jgi:hypothetical protein
MLLLAMLERTGVRMYSVPFAHLAGANWREPAGRSFNATATVASGF